MTDCNREDCEKLWTKDIAIIVERIKGMEKAVILKTK